MTIAVSAATVTIPILNLVLLFLTIVVAGAIDSIAGGGGLVSIPGYLIAGIPIHMAYGTNKFANMFGTGLSAYLYAKNKKASFRAAAYAVPAAVAGSWAGAKTALMLSPETLTLTLMIILPVISGFMLLGTKRSGDAQQKDLAPLRYALTTALIGLCCGFYDGFFGPGSGTFLILGFTSFLGLDFVTAAGTAKTINLASNLGAITAYILGGQVAYQIGIPCALFSIIGSFFGTWLAMKKGAKIIRSIMLVVILMLMVKLASDFIL